MSRYHHGDLKNALISAGADILSREGVSGLSLRKVAQKVGVSHTAPYAHFADKQALIAAISTEGYRRLYDAILSATTRHEGDALAQLVEASWAYVQFAMRDQDLFKVTMSGVVEKEQDHPDFVEMSQKAFGLVVELVRAGQEQGVLNEGPPALLAVSIWSAIHGYVSLLLEGQISHRVRDAYSERQVLLFTLGQLTRVKLRLDYTPQK